MTVDIPDFDPDLEGYSAVVLDGTCHAIVGAYPDGEWAHRTECGLDPGEENIAPLPAFRDTDASMCSDCWPAEVRED